MTRNQRLEGLLGQLGWNGRRLAREVNRVVAASDAIHSTTAYTWLRRGSVPHPPLPDAVCSVLSEALGRRVTPTEIWPALRPTDGLGHGLLTLPWTAEAIPKAVERVPVAGLASVRQQIVVSGPEVDHLVRSYEAAETGRWRAALAGRHRADGTLASHLESVIPQLRQLDDTAAAPHGQLDYIDTHLRGVARLVKHGKAATSPVTRRLLTSLAHLGQLAGWMAFELGDPRAQAYFILALRAARQAGDAPLAAHVFADMAFQAASLGWPGAAARFAEAADRAITRGTPAERACVLGRVGYAWAVAGQEPAFHAARDRAVQALVHAGRCAGDGEQGWAYYLTEQHLTAQTGYSLVVLGRQHATQSGGGPRARRLLAEGRRLLRTAGSEGYGGGPPNPRKAAFELGWSALAHLHQRDLEATCAAGTQALAHYDAAPTARTRRILLQLQDSLRYRGRNAYVRDFLPQLERALPPRP